MRVVSCYEAGREGFWLHRFPGVLHGLAEETGTYILLVHHKGHADRDGDRGAGRGASAIDDVPQVTWVLDRVSGQPNLRQLKVYGNDVEDSTMLFRVAPDDDPGKVLFWQPEMPVERHLQPAQFLKPEEWITTEELAWRISGKPGPRGRSEKRQRPPKHAGQAATRAREQWVREGLVEVRSEGNAKLIRPKSDAVE